MTAAPVAAPDPASELYAMDEALADALGGTLELVGSGEWFGLFKIHSCVYRNDRVFVVNLYCTVKEMPSFGVVVLSPTRGRAYIYAEADAPISGLTRADYFTFKGEAEPAVADDRLAPLDLGFTRAELRAWDERRYHRNLPGCYGGVELRRPQSGCMSGVEHLSEPWATRNRDFFVDPPDAWYRLIAMMRARAPADSKVKR